MDLQLVLRIISFVTASLVLIVGILVATGIMMPAYIPDNFRIIMGIAMIMYGIYRIAMLWLKRQKVDSDIEE